MVQPSAARVALITGASSGIGHATALAFARRGTHVIAIARREERLAQLGREFASLPAGHGDILAVVADVTHPASIQVAVQRGVERFGRLDILVASAGVGHRGNFVDASWADIETLLRTNIDGVLHSIRAAVPVMRTTGGGHIVVVSSVVANMTSPYAATYAASKAFVSSIARSLRLELEPDNIWVTEMLVGRTQTEFSEKRLGKPGRSSGRFVGSMPAERVAEAIVKASTRRRKTVILRWIDRLVVLGNILVPDLIGRLAMSQYK